MKQRILSLILLVSLAVVSCEKDEVPAPGSIGGTYSIYEIEVYTPHQVYELPNDEVKDGQIVLTVRDESAANVTVRVDYRDPESEDTELQFDCAIQTDEDGDLFMTNKENDDLAAYIWDNEIDFYAVDGMRLTARK